MKNTRSVMLLMVPALSLMGLTSQTAQASSANSLTSVGTAPVTLTIYANSGSDTTGYEDFGKLFHAKYPNVTINVVSQAFNTLITNVPHIISGPNPPDLIRLASFGNLVKDGLLLNLDPYAKAYGWDKWPQVQFESTRVAANGIERGTGSLYGVGPGFGLTGVYYNKVIAKKLGLKMPPSTLSQFDSDMAKAKAKGYQPLMVNGQDGGLAIPFENLQLDDSGNATRTQDWNYDKPGANIDTPATVKAATKLRQWFVSGYLPADTNSLNGTQALADYLQGKTLFYTDGNWDAPALDSNAHGKYGFFPFPSAKKSGQTWAMSASDLYVIPLKSKHANVAAAFLNFIQTDPKARQITVSVLGYAPGGPANASVPVTKKGSVVGETIQAFNRLLKNNGLVEFMDNATASMSVSTLIPQCQLLIAGQTTPQAFAAKLQSDYESDLGGN